MDILFSMTGQSIALSFILLIYIGMAAGLIRLYLTATRDDGEQRSNVHSAEHTRQPPDSAINGAR